MWLGRCVPYVCQNRKLKNSITHFIIRVLRMMHKRHTASSADTQSAIMYMLPKRGMGCTYQRQLGQKLAERDCSCTIRIEACEPHLKKLFVHVDVRV
jgi:hypothetical protein